MALSLTTIRNSIVTSIHGRRLGIARLVSGDVNSDALVGMQESQRPVVDATSDTTATAITGYGLTVVDTTTDDGWTISNPIPGVRKQLYTGSTSTGIRTIKRADNTFAFRTSASSTLTTLVMQAGGRMIELMGVSSAIYALMTTAGSTELAFNGTT